MNPATRSLARARLPRALAAATLGAGLLVAGTAGTGFAGPPPPSPQARAAELAHAVAALQVRAERDTQRYDAVAARLAALTTGHLLALRSLTAARGELAATASREAAGLRALYESGGPAALYGSLLTPGGLGSLGERALSVSRLVASERAVSAGQARVAREIAGATDRLGRLTRRETTLAVEVAAAGDAVRTDLATERRLLAAANARVRALERAAAARAADASDSAFSHALAAALAAAGTGPQGSPPTTWARRAIAAIKTKLGTPYEWGGTGPDAFDCSGLTGYAYEMAGVSMPRTAAQQYFAGTHPSLAHLRPGDLLFWASDPSNPQTIYHVAMYAGGNLMWSDDQTGDVARLQPIWYSGFAGATQIVPAMAARVPGPRWQEG